MRNTLHTTPGCPAPSVRPLSELNYEWHRWYNAQTGQWLTQDPLGLQAGSNPREYVNNDPTNLVDPSGMDRQPVSYKKNTDGTYTIVFSDTTTQTLPRGYDIRSFLALYPGTTITPAGEFIRNN